MAVPTAVTYFCEMIANPIHAPRSAWNRRAMFDGLPISAQLLYLESVLRQTVELQNQLHVIGTTDPGKPDVLAQVVDNLTESIIQRQTAEAVEPGCHHCRFVAHLWLSSEYRREQLDDQHCEMCGTPKVRVWEILYKREREDKERRLTAESVQEVSRSSGAN